MKLNWIASYPKSGNTWVRLLLGRYFEQAGEEATYRVAHGDINEMFFQMVCPVSVSDLAIGQQIQLRGAMLFQMACLQDRPTLVKTHHAAIKLNDIPIFPDQVVDSVIYVIRDPRDIVASFTEHMDVETRDEAIEKMQQQGFNIAGENGVAHWVSSWDTHVRSWTDSPAHVHTWRSEDRGEPLVVRYEDLHEDTHREVRRMLTHLGVEDIDEERIDTAVEDARFDHLKEREEEDEFPEKSSNQERFFRKGETGAHTEELSEGQIRRVEAAFGETMESFGYEPRHGAVTV